MTKIIRCSCQHSFQDTRYGAGRRVANATSKSSDAFRCTVCGNENTGAKKGNR